jgi:hypothetical protein
MSRKARAAILIAVTVALALLLSPAALASAGGGSAGYGGGGGGGGRGVGLYILIQILIRIAIFGHGLGALVLIGLVVLALLYTRVVAPRARGFSAAHQDTGRAARRRTARRERRVELAAAEAAEYDPSFAPDLVKPAATHPFGEI